MRKILNEINRIRLNSNLDIINEESFSDELFNGPDPNWDLGSPSGHKKRHPSGGWKDNNAYDIRPSNNIEKGGGTPVYSIVSGKVTSATNRNGFTRLKKGGETYNLFGSNLTVTGNDGIDAFYTHLENLQVKKGDDVKKGQLIGYIGDAEGRFHDHVHIAVSKGDVKDLVNSSTGKLKGSDNISSIASSPVGDNFDLESLLDKVGLDIFTKNDSEDVIASKIKSSSPDIVSKEDGEWTIGGYSLSDIVKTAKEFFNFESVVDRNKIISEIVKQKKKII